MSQFVVLGSIPIAVRRTDIVFPDQITLSIWAPRDHNYVSCSKSCEQPHFSPSTSEKCNSNVTSF